MLFRSRRGTESRAADRWDGALDGRALGLHIPSRVTWLRIDDRAAARPLLEDAVWFGRAEGLEAHARAAERRLQS